MTQPIARSLIPSLTRKPLLHIASAATALALTLATATAFAHTPLCSCYDNGDGTVLCEGGFSDGSSAAGVGIRVLDANDNVVIEGEMSEYSEFEFDKPDGDYKVVFDAGPGHDIEIAGSDIVE
ncbi:hypothetical protein [Halochromatium roseum]|uniref:hypothetical protein n=1 Tax=Halochromatium roseum TaxID=391920 RepID=UPI001F5CC0B0|nr:hypothetical protein [Halochromatium roseum]